MTERRFPPPWSVRSYHFQIAHMNHGVR